MVKSLLAKRSALGGSPQGRSVFSQSFLFPPLRPIRRQTPYKSLTKQNNPPALPLKAKKLKFYRVLGVSKANTKKVGGSSKILGGIRVFFGDIGDNFPVIIKIFETLLLI
jgi:hypothetical protein